MRKMIKEVGKKVEKHLWANVSKHNTLKKIVRWNNYPWYKVAMVSLIISILFSSVGINDHKEFITEVLKTSYWHNIGVLSVLFLTIIFPFLYFSRRKQLTKLEKKPWNLVLLAMYFSIIIPIVDSMEMNIFGVIQKEELIRVTQSITVVMLAVFVVYLFYQNFSLVILKKKKLRSVDINLMMAMYLVTGIVFSSIYFLIDLKTTYDAFNNVTIMDKITVDSYVKYLYFSFITLSTIGFGDITPISTLARLFVIIEAIFGVFLLSFSLGMVFSSGNNRKTTKSNNESKEKGETKACPFCAETIKKDAVICRYCGSKLVDFKIVYKEKNSCNINIDNTYE